MNDFFCIMEGFKNETHMFWSIFGMTHFLSNVLKWHFDPLLGELLDLEGLKGVLEKSTG